MSTQTLTRAAPGPVSAGLRTGSPVERPTARKQGRSSLAWMDLLRIGAIVAVVVIHAISTATKSSGTGWHSAWWWTANFLNSACLWCVPVFVMVSGALLLDPARRVADG